jgi:hypothetical protein
MQLGIFTTARHFSPVITDGTPDRTPVASSFTKVGKGDGSGSDGDDKGNDDEGSGDDSMTWFWRGPNVMSCFFPAPTPAGL